jgi:hypothetical protein
MFIVSEYTPFLSRERIVVTVFTINISRLAARNHFGTRSGSDGIKEGRE